MEFSAKHIVKALEAQSLEAELLNPQDQQAENPVENPVENIGKNLAIDSRKVRGGEIFVPIKTSMRDGHDFIKYAVEAGSPIFFISKKYFKKHGMQNKTQATGILVKDTLTALKVLAKHVRNERLTGGVFGSGAKVIAITGSVGKTSTKDLTQAALSSELKTHASLNSENNHLGVPLTLCNAPKETQALIAEVGSSARGEIASLAEILKPDIAVVTSIGLAHIEGFKNIKAIEKEKGDLLEYLERGTAILNADEGGSISLASRTSCDILTFGTEPDSKADIVAKNICLDENLNASFQLESPFGKSKVKLGVAGRLNVKNALAAIGVAGVLGIDLEKAIEGLSTAKLSKFRMELGTSKKGYLILNDTYNANPVSMKAALMELKAISATRHFAVLSTMKELGKIHDDSHQEIAEFARQQEIELISYLEPAYGMPVLDEEGLKSFLSELGKGDAVLFKASRTIELEKLVELEKPAELEK